MGAASSRKRPICQKSALGSAVFQLTAGPRRQRLAAMLKRLLFGVVKGILVGGILGLLFVKALGLTAFGAVLAYLAAVVTGVLTGLVAGKPIWAEGARIEAGLKAFVGALVGAGAMFVLRKWAPVHLDLGAFGNGVLGELPIAGLPVIATGLAMLYEIDNTGEEPKSGDADKAQGKKRVEELSEGGLEEVLEEPAAEERRSARR